MTVGVFGLGRFGTFWAGLLSERFSVLAFDRDPDIKPPHGVRRASLEELGRCPIVFLCVTIRAVPEVLQVLRPYLDRETIVADTCSVKVLPRSWLLEYLPEHTPILATHPMFGPDSGRNGVAGLPLVYCPVRSDERTALEWKDRFSSLGLSVIEMSPEEHDREAAYTQGVTHFIGRVLDGLSLKRSPIATVGYKKLLEIVEQTCNDPVQLFIDLQKYNPFTGEMRKQLDASYKRVMELIQNEESR